MLMSCDKDEDEIIPDSNFFKVGDKEYSLSDKGFITNFGAMENGGYNTDLTLYSEGLTLVTNDENDRSYFDGKGHLFQFEMCSSSGTDLDTREYVVPDSEDFPVGSFIGYYSINYEYDYENFTSSSDAEGMTITGKVNITKDGNDYTIIIDCKNEKGIDVTGFYSGPLDYFDVSNN